MFSWTRASKDVSVEKTDGNFASSVQHGLHLILIHAMSLVDYIPMYEFSLKSPHNFFEISLQILSFEVVLKAIRNEMIMKYIIFVF